jgi:transcriptional regulator with XRE-family HTH domain
MKRLDIKRIRKENKLTQMELAKLTGYPQGFISQMENGNESTPKAFITLVKERLNIGDISEYMFGDGSEDELEPKVVNSALGNGAKWLNGNSDAAIIRMCDMIQQLMDRLDAKDAQLTAKDESIAEMKQTICRLEAELAHLQARHSRS